MATLTITNGFDTNGQFPLDGKTYFATEDDVTGRDIDTYAYSYYEGMVIKVVETDTQYEWREEESSGETGGLLDSSFTYPDGLTSNNIDYSNRVFNFFPYVTISVFESSLDESLEMQSAIGSIPAGTTIGDLQGMTFTEYIELQNFPTIEAYIQTYGSLSSSGFSTSSVEVGTSYAPTLTISFEVGQINNGDNSTAGVLRGDLATVDIYDPGSSIAFSDPTVSSNTTSGTLNSYTITSSGTHSWTVSGTNAISTTTYEDNKGGTDTVAEIETEKADTTPDDITLSKNAYYPLFYGMATESYDDGDGDFYSFYTDGYLTKEIANTGNRDVTLNGTDQYIYFAYPSSFGDLSSILDGNSFGVLSSFEKITNDVTSTGLDSNYTEEYNIYKSSITSVSGQTFKFSF